MNKGIDMRTVKDILGMVLMFISTMFWITKCTEVEINRLNNKKPIIIYKNTK